MREQGDMSQHNPGSGEFKLGEADWTPSTRLGCGSGARSRRHAVAQWWTGLRAIVPIVDAVL